MASLYSVDSGDTVKFGLDSTMDLTSTPNGTRTMLTPPDWIKPRLPDWKNQLLSYRKNIIGILFLVLVGLLIGVMIKDSKGQPAQPSNKEKVDDNGYNGQCFVNGTCSDGHLLRATNAETLKDCETKCKSQTDCKLMTFNTEQNLCQQWSSCDKFSSVSRGPGRSSLSSSATTWSMACPFSDPCDIQGQCQGKMTNSFFANVSSCHELCSRNQRAAPGNQPCNWYSYGNGRCFLYTTCHSSDKSMPGFKSRSLYCEKIEDKTNGSGSGDKKYFKFLGTSWTKHIFKSISQPLIDCARYCQTAGTLIGAQNCEFYVQTRDSCHLGNFETNQGSSGRSGEIHMLLRDVSAVDMSNFTTLPEKSVDVEVLRDLLFSSNEIGANMKNRCASLCNLVSKFQELCDFYIYDGHICSLGNFHNPQRRRIGNQPNGTYSIQYNKGSFNQLSGSGCSGTGYFEVDDSKTWSKNIDLSYRSSRSCMWYIYNPNPKRQMVLTVDNFHTETSYDYLRIYEGLNRNTSPSHEYHGNNQGKKTIKWSYPFAAIYWRTDSGTNYRSMIGELTYENL